MGMSTHIKVVRDLSNDSEFERMISAKEACEAAGVPMPHEVRDYLNKVCDDGADIDVERLRLRAGAEDMDECGDCSAALSEYSEDMVSGYEVDLSKLPSWVSRIRFYNSF